jgi:hypothetical protein
VEPADKLSGWRFDWRPSALRKMRMRGLEPPPDCSDTDLNRARLPVPPHPRVICERTTISHSPSAHSIDHRIRAQLGRGCEDCLDRPKRSVCKASLLASWLPQTGAPPSSRGLGRRPLTAVTRVRIPLAVSRKLALECGIRDCSCSRLARTPPLSYGRRQTANPRACSLGSSISAPVRWSGSSALLPA